MKSQAWNLEGQRLKERSKRRPLFAPKGKELKIYEKYIKKCSKNSNALVLGATPEPRDLAIKYNLNCYAIDISQDMLDKYTKLMKYRKNPKNIMQKWNWLTINFKKDFFSIVMGDASFNNLLTKKDNEKLVELLRKNIKDKGYVVLRQFFKSKLRTIPLKKLIDMYKNHKITFTDFFAELRLLIPMSIYWDKKTYQMSSDDAFSYVDKQYKKGIITKKQRDKIFLYENKLKNAVYPEKEFIDLFEKRGFMLIENFRGNKYRFQKYSPMLVFQKK
jgi:ribosomal protein S20